MGCETPETTPDEKKVIITDPEGGIIPTLDTGTFVDSRDLMKYKWVKIGGKTWMRENLRYLDANIDGYVVNYVDYSVYGPSVLNKPRFIRNIPAVRNNINYKTYGMMYGQNVGNIAPPGWHIATQTEWEALLNAVGFATANDALKTQAAGYWSAGEPFTSKDWGFEALPSGYIVNKYYDTMTSFGSTAYFWLNERNSANSMRVFARMYAFYVGSVANPYSGNVFFTKDEVYNQWYYMPIRCVED